MVGHLQLRRGREDHLEEGQNESIAKRPERQ